MPDELRRTVSVRRVDGLDRVLAAVSAAAHRGDIRIVARGLELDVSKRRKLQARCRLGLTIGRGGLRNVTSGEAARGVDVARPGRSSRAAASAPSGSYLNRLSVADTEAGDRREQ